MTIPIGNNANTTNPKNAEISPGIGSIPPRTDAVTIIQYADSPRLSLVCAICAAFTPIFVIPQTRYGRRTLNHKGQPR